MNITKKIILTDTNIITDLDIAGVLDIYVDLSNVYMSDLVKENEINNKTGDLKIIERFKLIRANESDIYEISNFSAIYYHLSMPDIINFVLANNNNYILATGDKQLRLLAIENNIEVIGVIRIIDLLENNNLITKEKKYESLNKLKKHPKTRLPEEELNKRLEEIEKDLVPN
ncbi:MAG: hypothetical protein PHS45_02545 [Bacilli bacterium]|nr:hypothetical protein [Bacilli bacterium]